MNWIKTLLVCSATTAPTIGVTIANTTAIPIVATTVPTIEVIIANTIVATIVIR